MKPERFTYPFCYTPHAEIVSASRRLISRIDSDPELRSLFAEGKMLGVMMVEEPDGGISFLNGFSGLAGGRNIVDGFVPPIYDLLDPEGHFKQTEATISANNRRISSGETAQEEAASLKKVRREMSIELQEWIFDQFIVSNAKGQSLSIAEVFARKGIVPPSGTGECAAPKMLQYAYLHGLKPLAMGEFWYGASPSREIRLHGCFYPSCTGKCGPLLEFMLQGLEVEPNPLSKAVGTGSAILFKDESIIIARKESGQLAVPGKNGQESLQESLERNIGKQVFACHRLDMDTSGLIIFALSEAAQADIQKQFSARTVRKTYRATLIPEGTVELIAGDKGRIELPLTLDWLDRPRQIMDKIDGKAAVTEYEIIGKNADGSIDVRFTPLTGRTHQLRVHAAHPQGLGHPIKGDRLYGGHTAEGECLQLCADHIEFTHPATGERMEFSI